MAIYGLYMAQKMALKNEFYTNLRVYRRYQDLQVPPWSKIMTSPFLKHANFDPVVQACNLHQYMIKGMSNFHTFTSI